MQVENLEECHIYNKPSVNVSFINDDDDFVIVKKSHPAVSFSKESSFGVIR